MEDIFLWDCGIWWWKILHQILEGEVFQFRFNQQIP